jgi:hypothetical protein
MVELVLGIGAAFGASSLYSLGIALQAMDAKQAPRDEHLRLALVRNLLRRARWMLGTGISILGWPLQVLALRLAPIVVVQAALAGGLLVLLLLGERMLGERAGRSEQIAVLAILIGVTGAAVFAPARGMAQPGEQLTITLVLLGLGVASVLPYLLLSLGRTFAELTMVCAGLAFGWSAVATKLASDDFPHHLVVAAVWGLSTAAASGVGVLSETSALQERPAIQVAPVVFVVQTVVPLALAPLLFGERFSATALGGVPLGISLAVVVAGAAMLARSPLLLALMAGEPVSHDSGSAPNPDVSSQETIRSSPATDADDPSSPTTSTSPASIRR